MTLKEVSVGQTVKVAKLNGEGPVKRRIMDMAVGIVSNEEGHCHAVCKGAGGTDCDQRVHIGVAMRQRFEAADEKVSAAVEDRNG